MGASTAGVLSLKSISYNQDLVFTKIFWAHSSLYRLFQPVIQVFWLFKGYSFWSMGGGPEKDRNVCFCGGGTLRSLSSDSSGQLDIFWHDGDSPGMNGTQVGVIKQPDKVCLRCFLETQYRRRLEP